MRFLLSMAECYPLSKCSPGVVTVIGFRTRNDANKSERIHMQFRMNFLNYRQVYTWTRTYIQQYSKRCSEIGFCFDKIGLFHLNKLTASQTDADYESMHNTHNIWINQKNECVFDELDALRTLRTANNRQMTFGKAQMIISFSIDAKAAVVTCIDLCLNKIFNQFWM